MTRAQVEEWGQISFIWPGGSWPLTPLAFSSISTSCWLKSHSDRGQGSSKVFQKAHPPRVQSRVEERGEDLPGQKWLLAHKGRRPWCWESLKAGGEGDDRGWDGWMASPTQWTWIWASSGRWQRTGNPGVLQSMELHISWTLLSDWTTEICWEICWQQQI